MPRRFPDTCLSVPDALNAVGNKRFGDAWRPYCPVCLNRAAPDVGRSGRIPYRYPAALLMTPLLAGLGWLALFDPGGIIDDRYLTSRISFFVLAWACAFVFALYGCVGLVRQKGWFHGHPVPGSAVLDMWSEALRSVEDMIKQGRIGAHALTIDGALHPIDPMALSEDMIRRCIDDRSPEKSWRGLHRHLRLKNAPAGRLVLDRADLETILAESEPDPV